MAQENWSSRKSVFIDKVVFLADSFRFINENKAKAFAKTLIYIDSLEKVHFKTHDEDVRFFILIFLFFFTIYNKKL